MSEPSVKNTKKTLPGIPFKKGNSGRPKGTKNKFTNLKQMYLDTFEKIEVEGGKKNNTVKTLYTWATRNDKNQGMFYQMISKMLPSSLDVDLRGNITLIMSDKYLPKDDNGS